MLTLAATRPTVWIHVGDKYQSQRRRALVDRTVRVDESTVMYNRLENVEYIARDLGYGVGEGLEALWSDHGLA